jgi:hypothetical protein
MTYGLLSGVKPDRPQLPPRLSVDEREAIRVAATGAWRAIPDALTTSDPGESATATEVVTIPAVKFQRLMPKINPVPGNRGSITLELQRELARVGCYDGEINGAWTASTRQSVKIFMERVNATLPTNQPDPVLLALVQGHSGNVCGASCPPGQALASDGRCMPTALIPAGPRKDAKLPTMTHAGWSTTTTVAPELIDGQMALAGPKIESTTSTPILKSQQASTLRPRMTPDNLRGDWKAELWKGQN